MASTKFKIKLVIEGSRGRRVLYAEAGKDFADFLLSFLTLPVSTLIRLLGKEEILLGSLPNLYQSIETHTLSYSIIRPNVNKHTLLNPLSVYCAPIFSLQEPPAPIKCFYSCFCKFNGGYGTCDASDYSGVRCSKCQNIMCKQLNYVPPPLDVQQNSRICSGGYVKESVTYMVMDDLGVKPMCSSTSAIISLFKQFNIKDVYALEEMEVEIGKNEAVKLLKASFVTKMVLTSVFLDANAKKELT